MDSLFFFADNKSSKLLLKRIDNRDVESSIFAIGQVGEQDISRAVIAAGEKPRRLFPTDPGLLEMQL